MKRDTKRERGCGREGKEGGNWDNGEREGNGGRDVRGKGKWRET